MLGNLKGGFAVYEGNESDNSTTGFSVSVTVEPPFATCKCTCPIKKEKPTL
jgi:hypothetical protein